MLTFEQIIQSIPDAEMMVKYEGLTLADLEKSHPELDDKVLSESEQKLNLAFWAKASMQHVGWNGFGAENQAKFKEAIEKNYAEINGAKRQKDFMQKLAMESADYIQDRHYMLLTGSGVLCGGGKQEKPSVGNNIAYNKNKPDDFVLVGEERKTDERGNEYPLWQIGTMKKNDEDILVISIPNLSRDNSYEYWQDFIKTFDKVYDENREKWEKGRIVLDVRGNGGGEDRPIDHVAKRLYGNLVNTYKRCEINDNAISNKFFHDHGAYKPENYAQSGLADEDILQRKHFSNKTQVLFDETKTYYPFNEDKGYKGRMDVLIDRRVGSSAESAYTSFYHHPNVRYIGENTAGMQQFTQGSFAMPCGYLMRVGVTKLSYWDKEGENIEVKGHKPDVNCQGKDAWTTALTIDRDDGRELGFRELNEPVTGKKVYADYNPKDKTDPRKVYYAKDMEPALANLEHNNIVAERISNLRRRVAGAKVPQMPQRNKSQVDFTTLKMFQEKKQNV